MANTYGAPNFNIDTSTNIAGLIALKGSAIATTDNVFVFGGATLTIEQSVALNKFYLNENSTNNAATKTGYIVATNPGAITITLHDTTVLGGLSGITGTGAGYYSFVGSAGNLITIVGNTADKVSDYNCRSCPNVYRFCQFTNIRVVAEAHGSAIVEDCNITGGLYGYYFYGASVGSFLRNSVTDQTTAATPFYAAVAMTLATTQGILNNLAIIRSAATSNIIFQPYVTTPVGTTYYQLVTSAAGTPTQLDRIDQMVQMINALLS